MTGATKALANPMRRGIILNGAAAAAAFTIIRPTPASATDIYNSDEELIGLTKRWWALDKRIDDLDERLKETSTGWGKVFNDRSGFEFKKGDAALFHLWDTTYFKHGYFNPYWTDKLPGYEQRVGEWVSERYLEKRGKRRDELVKAFKDWKERVKQFEISSGRAAINDETDACYEERDSIADKAFAMQAHTLEGVCALAEIVTHYLPPLSRIETDEEGCYRDKLVGLLIHSLARKGRAVGVVEG